MRYYEIAYHDSTQPRRWPVRASCQRSVKSQRPGDPKNYKEKWRVSGFPADCFHKSLIPFRFRSRKNQLMYSIFTYIYHKNQPSHVGKYTSPMDGMGYVTLIGSVIFRPYFSYMNLLSVI